MLCLEPATRDLFSAPICKHSKETIRLYDNTCRCARGPTAVDTSTRGLVRGNCTGLDEDTRDNLNKVWCFLENVRDPLNPQSGCYSDVTWSEKDGRFWSSIACFEVKMRNFWSDFVTTGFSFRLRILKVEPSDPLPLIVELSELLPLRKWHRGTDLNKQQRERPKLQHLLQLLHPAVVIKN